MCMMPAAFYSSTAGWWATVALHPWSCCYCSWWIATVVALRQPSSSSLHIIPVYSSPLALAFFFCMSEILHSVPDNVTCDRWGSVLCDEGIHCPWFHLDHSLLLGNGRSCCELSIMNTSVVLEIVYQEKKNITFRRVFFSEPAVSSVRRRISGDIIP